MRLTSAFLLVLSAPLVAQEPRKLTAEDYARAEKLQVLDIEKLFDDGDGFRKTEYTRGDGTHISDEGYAALTAYAQKELKR